MQDLPMASMPSHSAAVVGGLCRAAALVVLTAAATAADAQPAHAHTHGRLTLDVAIDAQAITIRFESPLDNLLGFERAPRNDAERKRVADMTARLNAADLFRPDPAAQCRPAEVTLVAPVLGLGAPAAGATHPHAHEHQKGHEDDEHADIDVTIVFSCPQAPQARYIDVGLFARFDRLRAIDAQVAAPQGQFKRALVPASSRLSWSR